MSKKRKEKSAEGKLTIYEYEQKYTKRENARGARLIIFLIAAAIGVFMFFCLFSITMRVYDINEYAGYGAAAASVLVYILLFIVPLVKILKTDHFIVNVNAYTAANAKRHNKRVRKNIADKIIDLTAKVDGAGWYDSEIVGKLAIAVSANNDKEIMSNLTALYSGSVKKSAKELIFKSSLKSGMYSALSQTNKVDSMLVAVINLQLIKDLIFLYGFRPSDTKLVRIFARVLQNSLIAYGLGSVKIGNTVIQSMGSVVKGIPVLGSAISTLVDSSVQGLTNGVLTTVIGYQTIRYLNKEYRLQEILDGIEIVETEEEFKETCKELEKELKREKKGKNIPQAV